MTERNRTGLIAVGIVLGSALCIGGLLAGVIVARGKGTGSRIESSGGPSSLFGVSERSEGENWTLPDLAKYLQANGAVKVDKVEFATMFGVPMAEFIKDRDVILYVVHCDTPRKAKDVAAARGKEDYFGWGRFAISGNKQVVEAVRKALGV